VNTCRFCGKPDEVLFSLDLEVCSHKIHTFVCFSCMEKVKYMTVTLNLCAYCGNIFLTEERNGDVIFIVPQCGICEKTHQTLKGQEGKICLTKKISLH
jgi:hypothetical protein